MKKNIGRSFSVIFALLLLTASYGIFQTQATTAPWIQTVDSEGNVGWYSSLALDSDGDPHVSYYDVSSGDLKYASWTGSAWTIQVVDSAGDVGRSSSLALDSNDNPHISYKDNLRGNVKYASWTGSVWDIQTVGSGDFSAYNSLELDSNGNPHISYDTTANNDLKYASWTGSVWAIQVVDSEVFVGRYDSLALDSNDSPHISYFGSTNGALKYAHYDGSAWRVETVDSGGPGVGLGSSLALGSNGNVHISYFSFTAGSFTTYLKYAVSSGSGWKIVTVDSGAGIGQDSSLTLDFNDNPHISYYDSANGDLRYAWWTGSDWDIRIIDSEGNVGRSTSLALDSGGHAHISYYDRTNSDLKYAKVIDPASFSTPTPPPSPSPTPTSSLESNVTQKALSLITNVFGLNLTADHRITLRRYRTDSYQSVLPTEIADYYVEFIESKLRIWFDFINGMPWLIYVMEVEGSPPLTNPASTPLKMAENFLSNYEVFTGNPFYGNLGSTLEGIDDNVNFTETFGNVKLKITVKPSGTDIRWLYTFNGTDSASKCVVVNFRNGFLYYFIDKWRLYTIANTDILSEEEAKTIAMNAARNYALERGMNISGVAMTQLYFGTSLLADKPRSEDPLAMYPVWLVGVALDEWYGGVYGIEVHIWADTKEIKHIQEAFSFMSPEFFPQSPITLNSTSQSSPTTSAPPTPESTLQSDSPTAPTESTQPPSQDACMHALPYDTSSVFPAPNMTNIPIDYLFIIVDFTLLPPTAELHLTPKVPISKKTSEYTAFSGGSGRYFFYLAEPMQPLTTYTATIIWGQENRTQSESWNFTTDLSSQGSSPLSGYLIGATIVIIIMTIAVTAVILTKKRLTLKQTIKNQ